MHIYDRVLAAGILVFFLLLSVQVVSLPRGAGPDDREAIECDGVCNIHPREGTRYRIVPFGWSSEIEVDVKPCSPGQTWSVGK